MTKSIDTLLTVEMTDGTEALTDKPTTKDLLGYEQYTVPIARRIAEATNENTPMSIGIYGEWGSGKTSFLMMVSEELRKDKIYPIWFNAWKYEQEDNLWSALIQTILDQARVTGRWYERFWTKVRIWWDTIAIRAGVWEITKKVLPILFRILVFFFCVAIVLGWSSQEINGYLDLLADKFRGVPLIGNFLQPYVVKIGVALTALFAAKPDGLIKLFEAKLGIDFSKLQRKRTYQEHIAFLDEFNKEFKRIIKLIGKGKPIVIVIDDLDRCLPEKAVQVLETIKLFLDVQGCVFLLAVDKEIVEKAISVKYKDLLVMLRETDERSSSINTFLGENYFEKIIQMPFILPPLSTESTQTFISKLYKDEDVKLSAKIFAIGLPHNARKIKRVVNIFLFLRDLATERIKEGKIRPTLLAKLVLIQHQFRDLYREIISNPSLLAAIETYYRNQISVEKEQGSPVSKGIEDPILNEKIVGYTRQYSSMPLREILLQSAGDYDSFTKAQMEDYVYFVKTVTEDKAYSLEDSSRVDPNLALGQYLAYLLGISDEIKIPSSSVTLSLEKAFVESKLAPYLDNDNMDSAPATLERIFKLSGRIGIMGDPGSGKTTLLMSIVKTFADAMVNNNQSRVKERYGVTDTLLPVFISLREYSQFILNSPDKLAAPTPDMVIKFLDDYFARWNIGLPQNFFTGYLEQGKCILLFDGLDEVIEKSQRYYVAESVNALTSRYPSNRYIVTVRPMGFDQQVQLLKFDYYKLLPWSDAQIQIFIQSWFQLSSDPAAHEHADSLFAAIKSRKELRALAINPLLLILITQLYRHQGAVPITRTELYKHAVNMLMSRWDMTMGIENRDIDLALYQDALADIALKMFERKVVEINQSEVVQALARLKSEPSTQASKIISLVKERAGLLIEVAPSRYKFVHLSFQEYFAAHGLIKRPNYTQVTLEHKDDPYWQEVILFVIDLLMQGDTVAGTELMRSLIETSNPKNVILVGRYIADTSALKVEGSLLKQVRNALDKFESDDKLDPAVQELSKNLSDRISNDLNTV